MIKFVSLFFLVALTNDTLASGWIQKSDFGGIARHRTVGLSAGNKAYMGLGHYNGGGTNILFDDWWEYDPATNAWSQKSNYLGGICYHAVSFEIDNICYVGTGRISPGGNTLVQDFFKYDPSTNIWEIIASLPGAARRGAVSFAIDGYGYVGTGETPSGRTSSFYRYNPGTNTWNQIASFAGSSRLSAVAFTIGGFGYVGTGDASGGATKDFWQYNPISDQWIQKADVGFIDRQEAGGFALNGKGYIGTGDDFSSGNNFSDMYEYSPLNDSWVQIEDFAGTSRRYLSMFVLNGYGYAGLGTNGTNFRDFWMFDQTMSLLERNLETLTFSSYPNPCTSQITFSTDWEEVNALTDLTITITSMNGKVIEETTLQGKQTTLSTENYEKGMYLYSIGVQGKKYKSGKFIVN